MSTRRFSLRMLSLLTLLSITILPAAATADFDLLDSQNVTAVDNVSTANGGTFNGGRVYVAATKQTSNNNALRINGIYTDANGIISTNFVLTEGPIHDVDVTEYRDNIVVVAAITSGHIKLIAFKTNATGANRLERLGDTAGVATIPVSTNGVHVIRVGPTPNPSIVSAAYLSDGRARFDVWTLSTDGQNFTHQSTKISAGQTGRLAMSADYIKSSRNFAMAAQDANGHMIVTLWQVDVHGNLLKLAQSARGVVDFMDITLSGNRIYTAATNTDSPLATAEVARWTVAASESGAPLPNILDYKDEATLPIRFSGRIQLVDQGNEVVVIGQTGSETDDDDWQTMRFFTYTFNGSTLSLASPIKELPNQADGFDVVKNDSRFFLMIDGFVNSQDSHQVWQYN
ncbi:hypothetical protein [Herpetosiphon sp.]|uniref:Uncharacterized protein n=1 Tax=Herpetosiphon aurantiacus (strain ATCC 23779 / DSM 785 / 114-95) TaxID=316274 RepID=A9AVH0_HERA2|nr:hypothetical protein [Herpetosiphon sp.]ABX04661.1 hypothetical protein Haur_2018 [Herpetosiphon aurantiacus DSM 785]